MLIFEIALCKLYNNCQICDHISLTVSLNRNIADSVLFNVRFRRAQNHYQSEFEQSSNGCIYYKTNNSLT